MEDQHKQTEECPYNCPICTAIGLMKHMNPDVSVHLTTAAKEFMLAARAFLDSVSDSSPEHPARVEKIELD